MPNFTSGKLFRLGLSARYEEMIALRRPELNLATLSDRSIQPYFFELVLVIFDEISHVYTPFRGFISFISDPRFVGYVNC